MLGWVLTIFVRNEMDLLKYWGKQIFSLGSFTEVGQKQKTEKKKERQAGAELCQAQAKLS